MEILITVRTIAKTVLKAVRCSQTLIDPTKQLQLTLEG